MKHIASNSTVEKMHILCRSYLLHSSSAADNAPPAVSYSAPYSSAWAPWDPDGGAK